ncbi:hypothetical protein GCM10023093_30520 [Nemorincola caseinilytica]|uniref:Phosphatidate cytidylyltransferase n=1 Tax=Nemorincola caseinilytica TaxID=2054315 RepID=A0ABP8NN55_9BACT
MKNNISIVLVLLTSMTILLSSCELVGDIFQAGMGFGIFIMLAVIVGIVALVARIGKK